ncbi:hypothetical protein [Pedobacter agri]|uniref:hypothetical protein n=1 Tax=Pedobacter agri TaxID=454586 RepID=UPI0027872983|nr:hypothetical protein [Pedobacter agri]MDQ1139460.1 hypothetical protein [Pedobacter agri]
MKEQIEKISKKLKGKLGKRIINDERKHKDELTSDEIAMMEQYITIASNDSYKIPIIVKISARYQLDFIWWDREVDVLLSDTYKK